jgi:hypothetical protein
VKWILIGVLAESLISSGHETREACEGRAVLLREQKAAVKCVEAPGQGAIFLPSSTITPYCTQTHCQVK